MNLDGMTNPFESQMVCRVLLITEFQEILMDD